MIKKVLLTSVMLFAINSVTLAESETYRTDWGGGFKQDVEFTLLADNIWIGNYWSYKNGRIIGKNRGNSFTGVWVQDSSGKECGSKEDGSYYWGRLKFVEDGYGGFSGKWGYCNNIPSKPWNGTRLR